MAETIHVSGSGPWPSAEKSVQPFRSGLVKVEQKYTALTSAIASGAASFALDSALSVTSPAVDGLYVFPEPQWREMGGGFSEIQVTAYGRARLTNTIEEQIGPMTVDLVSTDNSGETLVITTTEIAVLGTSYICRYVTRAGEDSPVDPADLISRFRIYNLDGTSREVNQYAYSLTARIAATTAINFGIWTEWTQVVGMSLVWSETV